MAQSTIPSSNSGITNSDILTPVSPVGRQTIPTGKLQNFPLSELSPQFSYAENKQWAKPGSYTTKLDPKMETSFQKWVKANRIPWQDSPTADYDMRGYYKAMISGDPKAKRASSNLHFPDTWKTPYDRSFSNESMYATHDAPHWVGNTLVTPDGRVIFDEDKDGPG